MATLKEAVESGRRWRIQGSPWNGPGSALSSKFVNSITIKNALSSDFEIEPEPEKPREYWHHYSGHLKPMTAHSSRQCDGCTRVHDADACDRIKH